METGAQGPKEAGGGAVGERGGHLRFNLRVDSQLRPDTGSSKEY